MPNAVVVGAGISGLTAAFELHRQGIPVQVIEAGTHPGGLIRTETEQGYRIEWGPHTFPSTAPDMQWLCAQLGLTPQAAAPEAQKRYLYLNEKLQALPHHPLQMLTTGVLSTGGKLRALQGFWKPQITDPDLSVAEFMARRFGGEVVEHLLDPFISGVYAGDVRRLEMAAAFPRLWRWEQTEGNFIKGLMKRPTTGQSPKPRYRLLSFESGMAALTDALTNALPQGALRFNTKVQQLAQTENGFQLTLSSGETLSCTHLVLATPAHGSAALLKPLAPQASDALSQIPYNALNVVHFGFRRQDLNHPLDGFGFLIPRREKLPLLGTIWASALFPNRSPQGQALLTSFIGGAHHPEMAGWPPEKIADTVLENLRTVFNNPTLTPHYQRVLQYERAIPQYTQGHLQRIAALEGALQHLPNLAVTGNYLNGISLGETVRRSRLVVEKLVPGGR